MPSSLFRYKRILTRVKIPEDIIVPNDQLVDMKRLRAVGRDFNIGIEYTVYSERGNGRFGNIMLFSID